MSRGTPRPPRALRLREFPGVKIISVLGLIFLYLPILVTTVYAFNDGNNALLWQGFSTRWFVEVFNNENLISSVIVSLQIALIATLASTVMAILFALSVERFAARGAALAVSILTAPLVIPEIVVAVATLGFISMIGLPPGFTALVLAHIAFCIPFALMPIRARLKGLGTTYFEAATDLGASTFNIFRRITLPLLTPGIISGALLAFVISLDDFIISNFLAASGSTPLPVYLFSVIRKGASPAVNVVATLLLVLAFAVTTITYLLSQKRSKK